MANLSKQKRDRIDTELLKTISYQEYDFINSNKIKELENQIIKNIDIVNKGNYLWNIIEKMFSWDNCLLFR